MADWARLTEYLRAAGPSVTLSWSQLAGIVGELPASATNHAAWWYGERPHVRAWRAAGFAATDVRRGTSVTFGRVGGATAIDPVDSAPVSHVAEVAGQTEVSAGTGPPAGQGLAPGVDLLLVACVKSKQDRPAAAKDLYTSDLFTKQRAYAETLAVPWFILSAEHGLVAPDEWLAPYERYLPDTPPTYRTAWGAWVAARLELLAGQLHGKVVEVHAGAAYLDAVRPNLEGIGATIVDPLHGLPMGKRLAWYMACALALGAPQPGAVDAVDAAPFVELLLDTSSAVSPEDFLSMGRGTLQRPGLYSWWVDTAGATDLSTGLGFQIGSGLIYAGLAGATRWPSGKRSANTLWSRIAGMHLGGNHEFSTFRRTLGSILAHSNGTDRVDEAGLTRWMHEHLRVIAAPYDDADTLGRLEEAVLDKLDPPLNLRGMDPTPVRQRLKQLRRRLAR